MYAIVGTFGRSIVHVTLNFSEIPLFDLSLSLSSTLQWMFVANIYLMRAKDEEKNLLTVKR